MKTKKSIIITTNNWNEDITVEVVEAAEPKEQLVKRYLREFMRIENICGEKSYIRGNYAIITTNDSQIIEFRIIEREVDIC